MTGAQPRPDPWWSSDDEDVDPGQDPLAAHLSARGLSGDDEPGYSDPDGEGGAAADDAHRPGICGVCPICRGHATLQDRHPEVAGHLADAARSLSLALARFADLVDLDDVAGDADAATHRSGEADRPDGGDHGFRPIVLDDPDDPGGVR